MLDNLAKGWLLYPFLNLLQLNEKQKIPHCQSSSKAEVETTLIPLTQIQDRALCRFGTDASMKSWAKLVV